MTTFNRRNVVLGGAASVAALGLGAAVAQTAGTFGNPDDPAEGRINTKNPVAAADTGPQNPVIESQFPSAENPPPTDVNGLPQFWASFNNAHRRYQAGGWAREVTQASFAISEDFAGVNMRLGPNGVREMHWHQQAEWGIVTVGVCRVTILDEAGRTQVADVKKGDLWYFPAGLPHSLEGIGPEGTEFVIAFDQGKASEFDTLMVSDWMAHTPPDVLAASFGVPAEAFKNIPLRNLWIYQGGDPGPLEAAQRAVRSPLGSPPHPYVFALSDLAPVKQTKGGTVKIADSRNFIVSKTVAAALVTVKPGGVRELHWHPNADEWQYWIQGEGRMTVFNTGPNAVTTDFRPGDIAYVKKGFGHYFQNTGKTDLMVVELFKSDHFAEVSLSNWLTHMPPKLIQEQFNIPPDVLAMFPKDRPDVMPL
jgi:oxalate decarboxylase